MQYKNSSGEQPYRELAEYVLNCLSLPMSNAEVERIFSQLCLIKTKVRNKLSLKMLESIIRIRACFQSKGMCCKNFEPTVDMLKLFNCKMYENPVATKDDKILELL